MREIKFKAFIEGKMRTVNVLRLRSDGTVKSLTTHDLHSWHENEDMNDVPPIGKSTGLFDKNGVEIYEGYILLNKYLIFPPASFDSDGKIFSEKITLKREPPIEKEEIFEVTIPDIYARYYKECEYMRESLEEWYGHTEVIGNIYENPELIK